ncbi:MFS transporter [Streptomyces somaliensis]|uniref:MFS transporter n=1 Tax=Streptomyces somaliensis TaxID=78355 RepID=UPI0020CE6531|nr:MFS transporter [Streptomyces somaliensis]MCP9945681.1 MFS transporter [Streptomyces somaliensis]MCP9961140.1 MFS transporter [Streptomyces somaliensis]MCP9973933.1 MFS transporter [Streptomyces somaliensis]
MSALEPPGTADPHRTEQYPAAPRKGGGVMDREHRALSVGIISVVLLIAFEATAVGTAMPVAARELHGVPLYAFAFSAYFTTSLFGMVLAGQWADRSGPLGGLATGIATFGAGLVLSGTAGTMWLFIAGRAVQGFGGGLVIVALYVVVSRAYEERLRPAIMAAFAASWIIPSVVGPLAAGTVTERLGWRWVFLGIPVLVVPPLLLALPAIRRTASGPADPEAPGAGLDGRRLRLALGISVGAGLLQYAGQDLRWLSVVPAAMGAALLVPAVRGLMPRGTYRAARGLPSVVLLRGVAAGAFISAESFVPLMLVTERGLSPTLAGLSLAVGGATWALGSFVQSWPRAEPYRERLTVLGMLLVAASIAAVPSVLVPAVPVWVVGVAWGFGCFGMGMVISATSVLLLKLSAPEETGANSAALQISDALANVLLLAAGGAAFAALGGGSVGAGHGVAGAGTAVSHPAAFAAVFLPMAAVALVGAWVASRVGGGERAR